MTNVASWLVLPCQAPDQIWNLTQTLHNNEFGVNIFQRLKKMAKNGCGKEHIFATKCELTTNQTYVPSHIYPKDSFYTDQHTEKFYVFT